MDWTLTGALAGAAVLALTVGFEFFVITRSNPEPTKQYQATPVLIPARERPVVNATSNAPAVAYTPALQTSAPRVSNAAEPAQYPPRVEIPLPVGNTPKDHLPPPERAHNEVKPTPPQPQIISDSWAVQTTAKANYLNLGGHVDKNGVVDNVASGYLSEALKKHKNYPKLPAQIQAYINAPNVNLAKIAGYRALLGMDDKEMEEKQGVKFIRISSSRGIDITSPNAADVDAPPLDLSSLERWISTSGLR
jgi:hypothetical protein